MFNDRNVELMIGSGLRSVAAPTGRVQLSSASGAAAPSESPAATDAQGQRHPPHPTMIPTVTAHLALSR